MSSSIPTRRPLKTVRSTVKDIENATARAARIAQRTKAMAATAEGSDAKAAAPAPIRKPSVESATAESSVGKRKRGVLADVGGPNAGKDGKGKARDTTAVSGDKGRPSVKVPARRPLQTTVGGSRVPPTKTSTSTTTTTTRRKFTVASSDDVSAAAPAARRQVSTNPSTSTSRAASVVDDDEPARVFKKRHTTPEVHDTILEAVDESQFEVDGVAAQLAPVFEEEEEMQDWIDLDAEDADDPLMVSEYVVEVCKYMKEIELKSLPDAKYMSRHQELDWTKRGILLDWMLQIHSMYRCLPETWFLFVNIFDRFLTARSTVSVSKLQLVGISCFYVAAKFEESVAPSVTDIITLAGEQYKVNELLKAEQYVLKTLEWDLSYCGPMSWLRRGSKADDLDPLTRTVAKYLLEVASMDWRLVAVPSSMHAAASLWLARIFLSKVDWTPTLAHYAGYAEEEIIPIVNVLIDHLLLSEKQQSATLIKKYASKRFSKCSIFARDWVVSRWPRGGPINLEAELPRIKRKIREEIHEHRLAEARAQEEEELRKAVS